MYTTSINCWSFTCMLFQGPYKKKRKETLEIKYRNKKNKKGYSQVIKLLINSKNTEKY